jgi:hypothetical protein
MEQKIKPNRVPWAESLKIPSIFPRNREITRRRQGSPMTASTAKIFMLYAEQNGMPSPIANGLQTPQSTMSALPPKADILSVGPDVR